MLWITIVRGSRKGGFEHVKSQQRYAKGGSQYAALFQLVKKQPKKIR